MQENMVVRLTDIQQAFARQYMDEPSVIGVRICMVDGETILLVDVCDREAVHLPEVFRGLPVRTREGSRAVLAWC